MTRQGRSIVIVFVVVVALVVALSIGSALRNAGKYAVEVKVSPSDAKVSIDGKKANAGIVRLKEGTHSFSAELNGFTSDTKTVLIDREEIVVTLLPKPTSASALETVNNNAALQAEREALGALDAQLEGERINEKYPLLTRLPLGYNQQEFAIDYGKSATIKDGIAIKITANTSKSRQYALDQIKEWGYDPSDYEIIFLDYLNPLGRTDGSL